MHMTQNIEKSMKDMLKQEIEEYVNSIDTYEDLILNEKYKGMIVPSNNRYPNISGRNVDFIYRLQKEMIKRHENN